MFQEVSEFWDTWDSERFKGEYMVRLCRLLLLQLFTFLVDQMLRGQFLKLNRYPARENLNTVGTKVGEMRPVRDVSGIEIHHGFSNCVLRNRNRM